MNDGYKPAEVTGQQSGNDAGFESGLLTPAEAAKYLNVTERWVRRAVAERRIDFVKVGKLLRFRREDLAMFVSENRRPRGGS